MKDKQEEYHEVLEEISDALHDMAQTKEKEAEFYRTAANHIITEKWSAREFIEEAKERDKELVEKLPDIDL